MKKYINKYIVQLAFIARALITVIVAFTGGAIAQSVDSQTVETTSPTSTVQTVKARQKGDWVVGIDPNGNSVRVLTSPDDPLNVRVISTEAVRTPFQKAISLTVGAGTSNMMTMPIPAGKRLIIENVSFSGDCPDGSEDVCGIPHFISIITTASVDISRFDVAPARS